MSHILRAMSTPVDPRATRSREAMLAAARALLVQEGPAAVTHQRVARQAGVGRATAYRHWPRPEQLLLDVMARVELPFFREPAVPVRPWLRRQLRLLADELALPEVIAVACTLMGAARDPQIAARRDQFLATVTDRVRAALALAAADGELDPGVDPQDAAAVLIGPLLYRTALQADTVSDHLIDRCIDSVGPWHPGRG
jgi:AcrR family transcriptional regulator